MLELFCKKDEESLRAEGSYVVRGSVRRRGGGDCSTSLRRARRNRLSVLTEHVQPALVSSQLAAFQKHCVLIRTANVPVIFPAAKRVLKHCMVPFRDSLEQGYEGLGVVLCAVE
ncbi:hypothetical protein MHYP_G00352750 [Metynnis hypsauchen]